MSEIVQNQYSSWQAENSGKWIYNGFIYVGQVDTDPLIEANQVRVYYIDENQQEVNLTQPIRTNSSGFPVISETNSTVIQIRTDSDYSVKVLNYKKAPEWYIPKASTLFGVITIDNISGLREELINKATYISTDDAKNYNFTEGQYIRFTDRGAALFKVVTGQTPNGLDIIVLQNNMQAVYEIGIEDINFTHFGAKSGVDSTDAIKRAIVKTATLEYGGSIYLDSGEFLLTDTITIPLGVSVKGKTRGTRRGDNKQAGSVFIKAHDKDGIVFNRTVPDTQCFEDISLNGNHPDNTGGKGFVINTQGSVILRRVSCFAIRDINYEVGTDDNFTYAVEFDDVYGNTFQATEHVFYINSIDFRGRKLLSDGSQTSIKFTGNGDNWSLGNCRFEGFNYAGMNIESQQGCSWGRIYIANTKSESTCGVIVGDVANNINFDTLVIDRADVRKVGSIGLWLKDTTSAVSVRNALITSYDIGVKDESTSQNARTSIRDSQISGCNTCIYANSAQSRYDNIRFSNTQVTCIDHIGKTNGLWTHNTFDLAGDAAIKPTATSQGGNFNENKVRDNIGYKTRSGGYISSSGASPLDIDHGLSAGLTNDSMVTVTTGSGGLDGTLGVQVPNDTQFRVAWDTGETNFPLRWDARLKCDI